MLKSRKDSNLRLPERYRLCCFDPSAGKTGSENFNFTPLVATIFLHFLKNKEEVSLILTEPSLAKFLAFS